MNAETFNRLYPVGTLVFAYPGFRPEDASDARRLVTRTRTKAQTSASGDPVVWVDGEGSYICLTHVDPVPEDVWEEARAAEAAAAVVSVGDQPRPLDLDRVAKDLAAYEGHPDLGFACCTAHAVADHVPALLAEVRYLRGQRAADDEEYIQATAERAAARARVAELEAELDAEKLGHRFTLRQRNNRSTRLLHLRNLANTAATTGDPLNVLALIAACRDTLAASADDHKHCAEEA